LHRSQLVQDRVSGVHTVEIKYDQTAHDLILLHKIDSGT